MDHKWTCCLKVHIQGVRCNLHFTGQKLPFHMISQNSLKSGRQFLPLQGNLVYTLPAIRGYYLWEFWSATCDCMYPILHTYSHLYNSYLKVLPSGQEEIVRWDPEEAIVVCCYVICKGVSVVLHTMLKLSVYHMNRWKTSNVFWIPWCLVEKGCQPLLAITMLLTQKITSMPTGTPRWKWFNEFNSV